MPMMPNRPCTQPRCASYATKDGRCDSHQREAWESNKGKSSTERGYGSKWKKLRARVMRRDNYLCQMCKREGRLTEGKEVDHIKPKSLGGDDSMSNTEFLCKPCHKRKSSKEGAAARNSTNH